MGAGAGAKLVEAVDVVPAIRCGAPDADAGAVGDDPGWGTTLEAHAGGRRRGVGAAADGDAGPARVESAADGTTGVGGGIGPGVEAVAGTTGE